MKKISFLLFFSCFVLNSFAQKAIPKRGFAADWMVPKVLQNPLVPLFEKIELGINLPDSLEQKITSFVEKGTGINPFNPDEIDIKAEFMFEEKGEWKVEKFAYAFYFEDFKRITNSPKLDDWHWLKQKTRDRFRIRFTPTKIGKWKFSVSVKISKKDVINLGPYEFSVEKTNSPGFIKVSDNKHYLKLGENTFLPIGQNLPKPTCYFPKDSTGKMISDEYGCANCSCAMVEEWCPHLRKLPMNPKAYMTYLLEVEKLKNAGGNYFRMLIFPHTYEIEFDKVGDYSSRMNVAWELDKFFEKTEELDLKVHLNLFLGYPFTKAQYGVAAWDWYQEGENDFSYCYPRDLGLKEPVEFLTNPKAKEFYKKKLRYLISRWGYSTSIALLEIVSEINNKFPGHGKEVYEWQKEMAQYIKEELGHTNHLLTVSYVGGPPKGDKSYTIDNIDVVTFNKHREAISRIDIQQIVKERSKYNKPIIFSEIGTGDSEIELSDNNTEWKKDFWMALFAGTASAGLNWNEYHNYALWENFKIMQEYTKDINFDEFSVLENRLRKDKLVELLALKSEKKNKSIGLIHNLTWNYFTNSNGGACKKIKMPESIYQKFIALSSEKGKNAVSIKKMQKNAVYTIEWFDPFTGTKLAVEEINSNPKGNIEFSFPTLSEKMPFVVYKIYLKGEKFNTLRPVQQRVKVIAVPKNEFPTE